MPRPRHPGAQSLPHSSMAARDVPQRDGRHAASRAAHGRARRPVRAV